jgi:hypothetical protein
MIAQNGILGRGRSQVIDHVFIGDCETAKDDKFMKVQSRQVGRFSLSLKPRSVATFERLFAEERYHARHQLHARPKARWRAKLVQS